jgi:hypothetical protein
LRGDAETTGSSVEPTTQIVLIVFMLYDAKNRMRKYVEEE